MEEVYVVRHRHFVEGVPIRQLAREMGIPRNTIRRYLRGAEPGVGKPRGVPGAPVLDAVKPRAEESARARLGATSASVAATPAAAPGARSARADGSSDLPMPG